MALKTQKRANNPTPPPPRKEKKRNKACLVSILIALDPEESLKFKRRNRHGPCQGRQHARDPKAESHTPKKSPGGNKAVSSRGQFHTGRDRKKEEEEQNSSVVFFFRV